MTTFGSSYREVGKNEVEIAPFTITVQIFARSLANFYRQ